MCGLNVVVWALQESAALALVGRGGHYGSGGGLRVWAPDTRYFPPLTGRIGPGWLGGRTVTDAWGAYEACLPAQQRQLGKAPMQRLERKHLTLRTRRKRLTRKTICFSKKQFFYDGLITLFIMHFFF